jgi:hypothetical protein
MECFVLPERRRGGKKRTRGTGVFDIAKYIERTETATEVLRDVIKVCLLSSTFAAHCPKAH